jgi:PhnB protein
MADQPLIDRLDGVIDLLVARADASGALRDQELAPLARLAADLRHCPDRGFTTRLRARLIRRITMATALAGPPKGGHYAPVREGFTTVTPYVWVPDRGLADFLVRVFDAVETSVMDNPGHGIHRELRIGNSMLMVGETGDQKTGLMNRPVAFHVFVEDVDATFARAIAAGATSMGDPEDRPYGERSGFVRDAYGNHWYIATALGPQSVAHTLRTVTPYLHSRDVAGYMDFLARAFGAVEEARHEQSPGTIPYARVRIGDAAIEFGTTDPMPGAYFMYVADPDAVYEQALAAGATSLSAPADRPTGRIAFVEDPIGNHWYIARPA